MTPVPEIVRGLPHTTLAPCGGAAADCSMIPEKETVSYSWLQKAFWRHDVALKKAERVAAKAKHLRHVADKQLAADLRGGNPKALTFMEKIYRLKAMVVFR